MTDTIVVVLLFLIWFGNSRYGTAAMNRIESVFNQTAKKLRRLSK